MQKRDKWINADTINEASRPHKIKQHNLRKSEVID